MRVNTEDITVAWRQSPHALDTQYSRWRIAVFQDVEESIDGSKLYFLYDPQADEQSGTSGQRKGYPGLIIFDTNFKCFAGEISIHCPGKMKFLFALKCPFPQGGSSFVLVTEEKISGQIRLNVSRVDLSQDGLSIANVRPLISQALNIGGKYICSMREDLPEIVVMANPGLQVWRINCMAESAQPPVATFTVPGADLNHFYDGFLNNGNIIFLSASPDGHFDNTRVHLLSLNNPQHITSQNCTGDPQRGMPIPRKQCGFDSVTNGILMAGGEVEGGNGFVRLVDYWVLNTQTFQWLQIPSTMTCPLIEPRVTACHSGNIFVWGDFDQPLPGMPPHATHLRILRVTGLEKAGNAEAYSSYNPAPLAYPSLDDKSVGGNPLYPSDNKPSTSGSYGKQGGQSRYDRQTNTSDLPTLWTQFLNSAQNATKTGVLRSQRERLCKVSLKLSDKLVENGYIHGEKYDIWKQWLPKVCQILEADKEFIERTIREYFLSLHQGDNSEFKIAFAEKTGGMSIGNICNVNYSGMKKRVFVKCHQRGPRKTTYSTNRFNSANRPYVEEIFAYQLFSMIQVGGRCHFPVPLTTSKKGLYIATEQMDFILANKLTARTVHTRAMVLVDFLQFVMRLTDIGTNGGNFGQTAEGNPVIIDFWITPQERYEYLDNQYAEFWNVCHRCESRMIADILKELSSVERKMIIKEAVEKWSLIEKLEEAKTEVEQILSKNGERLEVSGDLTRYSRDVKLNVQRVIG